MEDPKIENNLKKSRKKIARETRVLRLERHWTQAELAHRLGLSQSRLSDIERGDGSFSAEHLLLLLQLFNVSAARFAAPAEDRGAELQNALALRGATHLRQSDQIVPADGLEELHAVLRQALSSATPRHLTALAPVIVQNRNELNLRVLHAELARAGLERRLAWVVENTRDAVRRAWREARDRRLAQRYRRTEVILDTFLEAIASTDAGSPPSSDLLDATIASPETRRTIGDAASSISKHWGIVSDLQPEDFFNAIRAADE